MTAALTDLLRGRIRPAAAWQALSAGAAKRAPGVASAAALAAPAALHVPSAVPPQPQGPIPNLTLAAVPASPSSASYPVDEDDAADDWDQLLAAVTARLGGSVAASPPTHVDLRQTVEECAQALAMLQALRVRQRGRERRLEVALNGASRALAAAQVELVRARLDEQRAHHQAQHDSLTSLPNRDNFSQRLSHALLGRGPETPALAVLFIDLDGFKPINDRHGHDTGDELLRIVASRLARSVRQQDMVCRLGGDEFACILSKPSGRDQLGQIAAKLFDTVSAPLKVGNLQLVVRPSIGIAMCPNDGETADALLKRADSAMYHAKRSQLGFAFFDPQAED